MSELVDLTATEQRRLIGKREVSATELLDAHLARIEAVNPLVNAIVALDPDVGRRRAGEIDDAIAAGDDPGPLAGLVTAHKDLTETADFTTTFGSPLFAGHRPAADCLLVARMKAAGAVAVGKTNTPEFGAGSHTFNEVYGVTRNPWGLGRSAGGSSGGAAVSLACRMVATADGSDTGGSLRNPAAWGNVVGFRPTVRVVPRVSPGNAWMPISTEGPMGRTVDDVALLLGVLAAPDGRDPMHRPIDLPAELRPPSRPVRVAWSRQLGVPVEASQLDVLAGTRQAMVDLGWDVVDDEPELALAERVLPGAAGMEHRQRPDRPLPPPDGRDQGDDPGRDPPRHGPHPGRGGDGVRPARRPLARDRSVLRPRLRRARLPRHPGVTVPGRDRVPDRRRGRAD